MDASIELPETRLTRTSAFRLFRTAVTSTGSASDSSISPSESASKLSRTRPISTATPVSGRSATRGALLGSAKTASERSLPTLRPSMSKAATTSMSETE